MLQGHFFSDNSTNFDDFKYVEYFDVRDDDIGYGLRFDTDLQLKVNNNNNNNIRTVA